MTPFKTLNRWWRWIAMKDEPEVAEDWRDDPHDPQYLTRIIHDDNFPFERWKP